MSSKPLANEIFSHQKLTLYQIKKDQRNHTHKQAKWVGLILFPKAQFNNIITGSLVGYNGYFFCYSLVYKLANFFCTIYCIICHFFIGYSIPQTFTVYQTLAISLLAMFFGKFLGFLGLNSILCWLGSFK